MSNNYSDLEIKLIKEFISGKIDLIQGSIQWADRNLKYEERNKALLTLKNSLNTIKKVQSNIGNKPVIAVFGASQVGKSYLIKNLLSETGKPFEIEHDGAYYDFLKQINPPGTGAESTGLVTRFTIDQDRLFPDFPIKVNLLTPKDILLVLFDAFFLDLKKITSFPSKGEFEAHLKKLELEVTEFQQEFLSEFEVLEIKGYFEKNLSQHTILFEGLYETRFFERIGRIIRHYAAEEWFRVFDILWNKETLLTELFISLIKKLERVQFAAYGFIKFDNVLREGGAILDVKRLGELQDDSNDKITTFKLRNGAEIQIQVPALSALIAELVFSIPRELVESKEFLKYNDLLDFPGARSRLALEQDDIMAKNIDAMLLRGKVSYLFNKYSLDFNINNLLFCTNDTQLNVNEIPSLLYNWIENNVGGSMEERAKSLQGASLPTLFVIFTFFNNQIKFDTTNDGEYLESAEKLNYKWHTRFERFFEQEIVTQSRNWHTKWTSEEHLFKNFYLLRDYKYSNDTFTGFEKAGYEEGIHPERENFLKVMRHSFTRYGFVQNHFSDAERAWDQVASVNRDGSALIIESLAKVAGNKTKINHNLQKLNGILTKIQQELERFVYKHDVTLMRETQMRQVNQFQLAFNGALVKDLGLFNAFIHCLSINTSDIFQLLNEHMVVDTSSKILNETTQESILLAQYPELKQAKTKEEMLTILQKHLWLSSHKAVEDFLTDSGIFINELFHQDDSSSSKSDYYVQLIIDSWLAKIDNLDQYNVFIDNGIHRNSLIFLVSYFKELLKKRKVVDRIVRLLNDIISEIDVNHGYEIFLTETFALVINELIFNFDVNYFTEEEKEEARSILASNPNRFFERKLDTSSHAISALFDAGQLDVRTTALQKYNKWIEYLRLSLLVNAGYIDYDEQANQELKLLVEQYSPFELV
ncbi:virulence factor SrfC family protein [Sphingobacterium paludis]|uniref:Putative virulence factor n=1 Tax=Sphingobacterium paludis TaxID=1476465 RepID=A0A4R7CVC3_9SPHI|nr:virulence factor SrfC family protein [Sphingobacterium paludis]TDS12359.1 putative virulence factor [Sphingobacterium paludis]